MQSYKEILRLQIGYAVKHNRLPAVSVALAVGDAMAHKHRNAVEFQTVNFDAGIAKIMSICLNL